MPRTNLPGRRAFGAAMPTLSREMDQLQGSIRRMFENPFAGDLLSAMPQTLGFMPPVEIAESDDAITVTAELPGMERESIHVELDGDLLTLRGEKQEERKEGDEKSEYHLLERSYGAFRRSFTLPRSVDPEKVTADFDNGVLTVKLPKMKEPNARGREILIGNRK